MKSISYRVMMAVSWCSITLSFSGCALASGTPFGFSPPQHRLLPEAKAFRNTGGIPEDPRELAKTLLPSHVVEPGDVLLVQPVELDTPVRFPPDQTVLPDGTIDLGKFGRPVVAGKTVPTIEAEIQRLVNVQSKEPIPLGVRIINRQSKVYYVLGEVNAPGAFPVIGRETVLDALLAAGGLTRRASEHKIILSRPTPPDGCRIVLPVCYPQIVQLGDTSTNYQIMPGDRIYVPSQSMFEGLFGSSCKEDAAACSRPQIPCDVSGNTACRVPAVSGPIQTAAPR